MHHVAVLPPSCTVNTGRVATLPVAMLWVEHVVSLQATLQAAAAGRLKLLYVTPECLAMSWVADKLHGLHISLACVDEAHHASERSPTCRPGCLQLPQRLARCAPDAVKYALLASDVSVICVGPQHGRAVPCLAPYRGCCSLYRGHNDCLGFTFTYAYCKQQQLPCRLLLTATAAANARMDLCEEFGIAEEHVWCVPPVRQELRLQVAKCDGAAGDCRAQAEVLRAISPQGALGSSRCVLVYCCFRSHCEQVSVPRLQDQRVQDCLQHQPWLLCAEDTLAVISICHDASSLHMGAL